MQDYHESKAEAWIFEIGVSGPRSTAILMGCTSKCGKCDWWIYFTRDEPKQGGPRIQTKSTLVIKSYEVSDPNTINPNARQPVQWKVRRPDWTLFRRSDATGCAWFRLRLRRIPSVSLLEPHELNMISGYSCYWMRFDESNDDHCDHDHQHHHHHHRHRHHNHNNNNNNNNQKKKTTTKDGSFNFVLQCPCSTRLQLMKLCTC